MQAIRSGRKEEARRAGGQAGRNANEREKSERERSGLFVAEAKKEGRKEGRKEESSAAARDDRGMDL